MTIQPTAAPLPRPIRPNRSWRRSPSQLRKAGKQIRAAGKLITAMGQPPVLGAVAAERRNVDLDPARFSAVLTEKQLPPERNGHGPPGVPWWHPEHRLHPENGTQVAHLRCYVLTLVLNVTAGNGVVYPGGWSAAGP